MLNTIFITTQLFFTIIIGIYFFTQLKNQRIDRDGINEDSKHVLERLNRMRRISLSEPLTEKTRPKSLDEIIGQENGVEALKVSLCGKNPQHILIYGPPGVGKTAASRVALEYAKKSEGTPFLEDAKFIEVDATIMQYDERSIADPLIGSVHDPIYQGAGAYGPAGVPQPKEGAVSKAHGGVLFIDEIGELQQMQLNRLLKVLEDRKVKFESAYYSSSNKNIPKHIHDIFKNGIPADFRLIGATTKSPEEIPPAIRSRCTEIYFNSLGKNDILRIINNAILKTDIIIEETLKKMICNYVANGRDTVRFIATLSSKLSLEKRKRVLKKDIEWVIETGRFNPVYNYIVGNAYNIGKVNALAVTGNGSGMVIPIEAVCEESGFSGGKIRYGGITESETIETRGQTLSRASTAKTSVDNVLTVLENRYGINLDKLNIHINIPGGIPVDGPSAGISVFVCCYSAIKKIPISEKMAFTGEVSIHSEVLPVGGVREKIDAAISAGINKVVIPKANFCERFKDMDIEVIPVKSLDDIFEYVFENNTNENGGHSIGNTDIIAAKKHKVGQNDSDDLIKLQYEKGFF